MASRESDLAERLGAAIDYIEDSLTEGSNLDEAARRAGFSRWHFMRLFQAASGFSPGDYIRRRRLFKAALSVAKTDKRLIDIALDAGYESQEAFTRAFQRVYELPPAAFRRLGIHVEVFRSFEPRHPFALTVHPVTEPSIEHRGPFRIIGQGIIAGSRRGDNFRVIPCFWQDWLEHRRGDCIPNTIEAGIEYGVCQEASWAEDVAYAIGRRVGAGTCPPAGYLSMDLEESTYGVFRAEGDLPASIQSLILSVYSTWLPEQTSRRTSRPDLEVYDARLQALNPPITELWIPLGD